MEAPFLKPICVTLDATVVVFYIGNSFSDGCREVRRILENVGCRDFVRNVKDSRKFHIFNLSVRRNVNPLGMRVRLRNQASERVSLVS